MNGPEVDRSSESSIDSLHGFNRRLTSDRNPPRKQLMALGIYKQGQGYWVRMLTAIFAGVLVLAGAAWAYQSIARVSPPSAGRDVRVEQVEGSEPTVGSSVDLLGAGESTPLATAVVRTVNQEAGALLVRIGSIELTTDAAAAERDVSDARLMRNGTGFQGQIPSQGMRNVNAFEMAYVQAGVAGAVILVGAWLIYTFVGKKPKQVDFLVATDAEARKVNWSTRKEVVGSTWVVIGAMFLIAGTLFVIDLLFQGIFTAANVLER